MGRAPCCEKVGLNRGRWTAEEDEILSNYIQANGEGSWRSLPKNAGLLRCGKSCRLRWINYLRADLKRGNFTREEEELIIKLHHSLGNRWSLIASHLQGRTDNEIKNYWNSHLRRKIYSFRKTLAAQSLPVIIMDPAKADIAKRKGGRTSKKTTMEEGNKSFSTSTSTSTAEKDDDGSSNKPITDHNVSIDETVQFQSTLLLERETRSGDQDSMPCPMGSSVEEEDPDDILATLESIESSGMLCFDDIMVDDGLLLGNADTNVQAELGSDKVTVNVGVESGDCEDLDSWFSTTSCIIDDHYKLDHLDWDWETVVQWNDNMDCNNNMASWMWEDNDELASHA